MKRTIAIVSGTFSLLTVTILSCAKISLNYWTYDAKRASSKNCRHISQSGVTEEGTGTDL